MLTNVHTHRHGNGRVTVSGLVELFDADGFDMDGVPFSTVEVKFTDRNAAAAMRRCNDRAAELVACAG